MNQIILIGTLKEMPSLEGEDYRISVLCEDDETNQEILIPVVIWRGMAEIVASRYECGCTVAVKGHLENAAEVITVFADRISFVTTEANAEN